MKRFVPALMVAMLALPVSIALAAVKFHAGPRVTENEGTNQICVLADISGLGNEDVNTDVTATFTATTVCRNNGGNTAPGQGVVSLTETFPTEVTEVKNGRARINFCTAAIRGEDFPTPSAEEAGCPNGNWTVDPIRTQDIRIQSFSVEISQGGDILASIDG